MNLGHEGNLIGEAGHLPEKVVCHKYVVTRVKDSNV